MYNTFKDVLLYTSKVLLGTDETTDEVFNIEGVGYVSLGLDGEGDIQVSIYQDEDCEEELDGGGACVMFSNYPHDDSLDEDDDDFETEADYINNLLETGTPEDICKLVNDKALFVWDLVHSS